MKKILALLLILAALGAAVVEAQQPGKIHRVGYLVPSSLSVHSSRLEAFRQGLRELGYVEGKSIWIEYRYAEGKQDRLNELAAELVRLKVDVIVTSSTPGVLAVKRASTTIPIVVAAIGDPVRSGLVASLARPGGNITGLTILAPELSGKRLELLKEVFPKATRVAILWNATGPALSHIAAQAAAKALGLELLSLEVRDADDIESAFEGARRRGPQALVTTPGAVIDMNQKKIVDFAAKSRLPAMYAQLSFVDAGGLMAYAPSATDLWHRAALYVDKILKGAKPADLPIEQPTKFELIINLKAAKQIGLTIPPEVLMRADRVIK